MNNPVKLFIVEGEDRDYRFVNEMTSCFFHNGRFQSRVINLPAEQNIYMLYKELEKDDFETDIVEVLRERVPTAGEKLMGITRQSIDEIYMFFDYDIHQDNTGNKKINQTAENVLKRMLERFDNETEHGKLYISYPMVEALFDLESLEHSDYLSMVSPLTVFQKEIELKESMDKVFVLSAFPEFLFDYFKADFWKTMTPIKKYKFDNCPFDRC